MSTETSPPVGLGALLRHGVLGVVLVCAAVAGVRLSAQEPAPPAQGPLSAVSGATPGEPAVLQFANRSITTLRATVLSRSAGERAAAARERLERILHDHHGVPGPASSRPLEGASMISVGGRDVFAIFPLDVNDLAGETQESKVAAGGLEPSTGARRDRRAQNAAAGLLERPAGAAGHGRVRTAPPGDGAHPARAVRAPGPQHRKTVEQVGGGRRKDPPGLARVGHPAARDNGRIRRGCAVLHLRLADVLAAPFSVHTSLGRIAAGVPDRSVHVHRRQDRSWRSRSVHRPVDRAPHEIRREDGSCRLSGGRGRPPDAAVCLP